jgi:hypothetical protein
MTSPHYKFNDLNEFYMGQNWALATPACFLFSFEDIPFLLTETDIIDKTPNDWEEWKGDKDEEHIPEFIEDLGFKELGKTGYYWIEEQVDKTAAECLRKRVAEEDVLRERLKELLQEEGKCGSCGVELDHCRDGTETDGHRCHNCYWEQEGSNMREKDRASLIYPDYRIKDQEEEEEKQYEMWLDGGEELTRFSSKEKMKETFDRFVKEMEEFGKIDRRRCHIRRPTKICCYGDDEVENWCWEKKQYEIWLDGGEEKIPFSSKEKMKETVVRFVKEMEEFGVIILHAPPLKRPTTIDCYGDDEVENWCWEVEAESDSSD